MAGHTDHRTYSESWHRVAQLNLALRPAVQVRKQLFRGATWYVFQDPFNNNFFRMQKAAYSFVARLHASRTVDAIWQEQFERDPENAPGQEEVIRLLAQLYHANLLYSELPVDSRRLFERYKKKRQQENRSKLMNLMFVRIPLFDPNPLLNRYQTLVHLFTSRWALILWLIILLLAGKTLIDHFDQFILESQQILAFNNLILLYGGMVIIKGLHELGHTLACKRYGGEVHTIGLMLIVFAPVPFMDATSSWALRSRRSRIFIACAGMMFEFFFAACATFVWALSSPGVIHSLALNMLLVASVSTLLFNANPLMRYDGYYILSDLLNIPNLQSRASIRLKYLCRRYLLALKHVTSPANTGDEAFWLTLYGCASGIYRVLIYTTIILFVADRFLALGIFMALFCLLTWGVLPIIRFLGYLSFSPELEFRRIRTLGLCSSIILIITLAGFIIPFPQYLRVPGIIQATGTTDISNNTSGKLLEVVTTSGSHVEPGQKLVRLVNPELDIEIAHLMAQREEVLLLQQQSTALKGDRTRKSLQQRLMALDNREKELKRRKTALQIRAEQAGIWSAPDLEQRLECWLPRGENLGQIVTDKNHEFTAIIQQENTDSLFNDSTPVTIASVRLTGFETTALKVKSLTIIPFEQTELPSAALGWNAGGTIPTRAGDGQGLKTIEPFFQISATLPPTQEIAIRHGQSGLMRIHLPPKPLFHQIHRKVRQFIQKRYQT